MDKTTNNFLSLHRTTRNNLLTFILVTIFTLQNFAQGRWERIESPTNSFLRRITLSDPNTLWASGHNGTIIKSTDQGNTWTVLQTNTNNIIMNHSAVNNQLVFALTWELDNPPYGTKIIKTTNGGISWQSSSFPIEYEYLQSVHFFNKDTGIVAGSRTYLTTNGGLNWFQVQRDSDLVANLPFLDIKMFNKNYGFACGGFIDVAGVIWKTTNGGLNWKTNGISPDEIFDLVILDSLNILALSGDPEFIYNLAYVKSTDGGETWNYTELPMYAVSLGIDAKDMNNIWSAAGYKFIYSTDGGNNWQVKPTPDSASVYDLIFINSQKGFACGEHGVLLKYVEDGSNVKNEDIVGNDFILYQNYPNPFNASTSIRYSIPTLQPSTLFSSQINSNQNVTLKVYDILGREVTTLVNENKSSGIYEIEFNGSELISGVYFYKLTVGNFSQTKKMFLIR